MKAILSGLTFLCLTTAAMAEPNDPGCRPFIPDLLAMRHVLTQGENLVLFSGDSDSWTQSVALVGQCRSDLLSGRSTLNCIYTARSNLESTLILIQDMGINTTDIIFVSDETEVNIPDAILERLAPAATVSTFYSTDSGHILGTLGLR